MGTAQYWIFEYIQVALSYGFLMFVWPQVVFAKHLKKKHPIYQFSFCASVQPVLVNTVVLGLGLIHLLNRWTVCIFFYGIFLASLYRRLNLTGRKVLSFHDGLVAGGVKPLFVRIVRRVRRGFWLLWRMIRRHPGEYAALGALLLYALIYFSWGAFQVNSYGFGDLYVHHSWIYGLKQGKIFSGGVYPQAMHCFIYTMNALLGVRIYSCMLFMASIQAAMFLLAAYCLLRELFHWKYTPLFVLCLFLLLDMKNWREYAGVARLGWTLPLEFGLSTAFICVLFLIRYLKRAHSLKTNRLMGKIVYNKELFIFMASLAATVSAHFYPAIIAFFLCLGVAIIYWRSIFSKERFLSLAGAVLCGAFIAAAPMVGALISGIPFQASIDWAVGVASGTDTGEMRHAEVELADTVWNNDEAGLSEKIGETIGFCSRTFQRGYHEFVGDTRGNLSLWTSIAVLGICLIVRLIWSHLPNPLKNKLDERHIPRTLFIGYPLLILDSIIIILLYVAPYFGLPELILGVRLVSSARIFLFAAILIPLDIICMGLAEFITEKVLSLLSMLCLGALSGYIICSESYHGFLYNELTRYNSEVSVIEEIIGEFPQNSYTIVSPSDGLYHVIEDGWHEELLEFVTKVESESYFLPTEHNFILVEKEPLDYAQTYGFDGPRWLGVRKSENEIFTDTQAPEIWSSRITEEAADSQLRKTDKPFLLYKDLDSRTIVESKAYYWCQRFAELYPNEMKVYYEDEVFVCYYFRQEPHSPYNLAIDYENE